MQALFWVSALFIGYVYIGYLALLAAWAKLRPRRIADCGLRTADSDCGVSIVIAARNEAHRLTARIENLLALDCEASEVAGRRAGAERRRPLGDRRVHDDRGPGRRAPLDRRGRLASRIADGVSLYWRYEKQLRRFESAIGSTLGATVAIYALRRSLFRPLPEDTILDDVLVPMRVVLAGYRVVFSQDAYAFDRAPPDADP